MRAIERRGAALAVLLGAVFALVLLVAGFRSAPAGAQQTLAPDEVVTEQQRAVYRNVLKDTKSPDPAKAGRAQRALTRSFLRAAPRAAPVLLRASLVGTAAYVWHHNYVTLKEGLASGEVVEVHSDFESRLAEGAVVMRGENPDGSEGSTSVLVSYRYEVTGHAFGDYNDADFHAKMVSVPGAFRCGQYCSSEGGDLHSVPVTLGGNKYLAGVDGSVIAPRSAVDDGTFAGYKVYEDEWVGASIRGYGAGPDLFMTDEVPYGAPKTRLVVDNCPYVGCKSELAPPTVDLGGAEMVPEDPAAPEGSFVASARETAALYAALTDDREYDPAWAEHPWDRPDRRWDELEPPGTKEGNDEDEFGPLKPGWPKTSPNGDEWYEFEDGTVLKIDGTQGNMTYENGNRRILFTPASDRNPPDPPVYLYRENDRDPRFGGLVPCAPDDSEVLVARYPTEGLVRRLYFPAGTPEGEMHSTTPTCETWTDLQGAPIDAPANPPYIPEIGPMGTPPA